MSEIEDWLRAHEDDLATIARELDVDRSLVHVTAVFAFAGMTDSEIHQQLLGLLRWLDGHTDPLGRAQHALEQIRRFIPPPPGVRHTRGSHLVFGHED
jgi:hypothetical protein